MKTFAALALCMIALTGCATVMGDVRTFPQTADATGAPTPAQVHAMMAQRTQGMQGMQAQQPAAPAPAMQPAAGTGGSIYAGAAASGNRGMRLFQDNKAREVGDILTIVLVERTASSTKAQTAVQKDSGIGISAPVIGGIPTTINGRPLSAEVEGSRTFAGGGDSQQSNRLDGTVTVTVVQDLGNGNLLVAGDKKVRLNQGDEVVQVQGIVRVSDIGPDNRIASDRVADARIVYGGRGTLARSNAMGWLGRFFNSAAFPY
ncbi:MAG: flagellar basal body L-ring protein FlgH [Pseudomonadota bacterium]